MTDQIKIQNIAKIRNAVIEKPEGGGVIVLRGRNGVGKSTTLNAIDAAVTGKTKPSVTHGEPKGTIEAFGVTLHVGKQTRRTGELEISGLDGRLSISDLIDPEIKDPEIADQHRLKALVSIITPNPNEVRNLVEQSIGPESGNFTDSAWYGMTDPVAIVAHMKRKVESKARAAEESATRQYDEAKRHHLNAGSKPTDPGPIDELRAAHTTAIERRAALKEAIVAWDKRRLARMENTELLEHLTASIANTVDLEKEANELDARESEVHTNIQLATKEYQEIECRIRDAKAMLERLEIQLDAKRQHVDDLTSQFTIIASDQKAMANRVRNNEILAQQVVDLTVALQQADPNPTDYNALADADQACLEAETAIMAFKEAQTKWEEHLKADEHTLQGQKLTAEATQWRKAAANVEHVLTTLVQSHMKQLVVDNGRLYQVDGPIRTLFAELSHGQRARIAVEIGLRVVGQNGVIVLSQAIWEGLDPINRQELNQIAKSHTCWIITAVASDDPEMISEAM